MSVYTSIIDRDNTDSPTGQKGKKMEYIDRLILACRYYSANVDNNGDAINDAANIYSVDYEDYCKMYADLESYATTGYMPH